MALFCFSSSLSAVSISNFSCSSSPRISYTKISPYSPSQRAQRPARCKKELIGEISTCMVSHEISIPASITCVEIRIALSSFLFPNISFNSSSFFFRSSSKKREWRQMMLWWLISDRVCIPVRDIKSL
jgi:hypothetical protein